MQPRKLKTYSKKCKPPTIAPYTLARLEDKVDMVNKEEGPPSPPVPPNPEDVERNMSEDTNDNVLGDRTDEIPDPPENMNVEFENPLFIKTEDEYYGAQKYAQDHEEYQKFAQLKNGKEIYLLDTDKRIVYPNKYRDTLKLFARYTDNTLNIDTGAERVTYPTIAGEQTYPTVGNKQVYLKNADGNEVYKKDEITEKESYAKDENDQFYFATRANGTQYYATQRTNTGEIVEYVPSDIGSGKLIFIKNENDKIVYPINTTTRGIYYPRDADGNVVYERDDNGNEIYWVNQFGAEEYGKDNYSNDQPARQIDGYWKYAKDEQGNEYYPTTGTQDQYYLYRYDRQECARNKDGYTFYAKNHHDDEIYPRTLEKVEDYREREYVPVISIDK